MPATTHIDGPRPGRGARAACEGAHARGRSRGARIYEGHAIDAALEQRRSPRRRSARARDKRGGADHQGARGRQAPRRCGCRAASGGWTRGLAALDRRGGHAADERETRRRPVARSASRMRKECGPAIAGDREAVGGRDEKRFVDETAEVVSPSKEAGAVAPAWRAPRGHPHLRYAAVAAETGRGLPQQEGLPRRNPRLPAHGAPSRSEPPSTTWPSRARSAGPDVLSRETGESREAWRTKIFGASPPPIPRVLGHDLQSDRPLVGVVRDVPAGRHVRRPYRAGRKLPAMSSRPPEGLGGGRRARMPRFHRLVAAAACCRSSSAHAVLASAASTSREARPRSGQASPRPSVTEGARRCCRSDVRRWPWRFYPTNAVDATTSLHRPSVDARLRETNIAYTGGRPPMIFFFLREAPPSFANSSRHDARLEDTFGARSRTRLDRASTTKGSGLRSRTASAVSRAETSRSAPPLMPRTFNG